MFKGQPKGLFVLALANMGERFGFYTMIAIFVLFIQAKFGFSTSTTGTIYTTFLASVYFLPLFGGLLADKVLGYGKTIAVGIVVMFCGYLLLAIPTGTDTTAVVMMVAALLLIAMGTGCFKGNLQALVGNLYDNPKYASKRDLAFSIFYMCINVGAFFAPTAAEKVSEYFLRQDGFTLSSELPALSHQLTDGTISAEGMAKFEELAAAQGYTGTDLATFGQNYIDSISKSYNFGFAVACFSLVVSMLIFLVFRNLYKAADKTEKQKTAEGSNEKVVELTPKQTKDRLVALGLVFAVVIFFWMAFHQNGLTMTFFARDYTQTSVHGLERFGFSLLTLIPFAVAFYGIINIVIGNAKDKLAGLGALLIGGGCAVWAYNYLPEVQGITPQIFQQFNAFFIVILTPVAIAFFSWLNRKGREPLAPRKIGIGMIIAALGFVVLAVGSIGLPTPDVAKEAGGVAADMLVSPNWLISSYLVLTIAELFLSPMGISFVSKVAPPKYKGVAQGGWLAATAVGNYLVAIGAYLWGGLELWMVWSIFIVLCLLSAAFLFSKMKKLEETTRNA